MKIHKTSKLQWFNVGQTWGQFAVSSERLLNLVPENLFHEDATSAFNGAQLHAHISVIPGHTGICTDNTYLCKD